MDPISSSPLKNQNITHIGHTSLSEEVTLLKEKIQARGDLPHVSVKEQLELLEELAEFPLGQFLILNKGLDGRWTDYILRHPKEGRVTGLNLEGKPFSKLEDFLLNHAPSALATQERFEIFQNEIQNNVKDSVKMASIPCGLMGDLLSLNLDGVENFELFGLDIDSNSIDQVQKKAYELGLGEKVQVVLGDAWTTSLPSQVDLIASNGLNIYERDDAKVVDLYRQFFNHLKPGGTLVTSFLTLPPPLGPDSEWEMSQVDLAHARLQRIVFVDIVGAAWQAYRSSQQVLAQLEEAGFESAKVIRDQAGIFPTIVVKRPRD